MCGYSLFASFWKVLVLSLPLSRLKKLKAPFCQKQSHLKLSSCFKIWDLTGTGNCNIWLSDKDVIISLHLEFMYAFSDVEFQNFRGSHNRKNYFNIYRDISKDNLQVSGNGLAKVTVVDSLGGFFLPHRKDTKWSVSTLIAVQICSNLFNLKKYTQSNSCRYAKCNKCNLF